MIAHLKGRLDATGIDHAVIDVGGVGYLVGASARTLSALGPVGEAAMLHTEMLVSDDAIRLVGFAHAAERDWFRLLTGVQGGRGAGRAGDPVRVRPRRPVARGGSTGQGDGRARKRGRAKAR